MTMCSRLAPSLVRIALLLLSSSLSILDADAAALNSSAPSITVHGAAPVLNAHPTDEQKGNVPAPPPHPSSPLDGLEEAVVHLPPVMKHMISSALSGMDRAAGGLLSELSSNHVDFAKSRDGKSLIARLHVPAAREGGDAAAANRKLHVSVIGRSHMRVRTEMLNGPFRTSSTHTIRLPHPVSAKGVTITPASDGSVHVHMRLLSSGEMNADEDENGPSSDEASNGMPDDDPMQLLNSLFQRPLGMPMFNVLIPRRAEGGDGGSDGDLNSEPGGGEGTTRQQEETVAELPSAANMLQCRQSHGGDALRRRKCLCDVTPSDERRAVCYAELISRCVRVARRLNMDDFATSAKHIAMECANERKTKTKCLADVTQQVLFKLSGSNSGRNESKSGGNGEMSLEGRIRTALESEDDGPSEFHSSTGTIVIRLILILGLVGAAFVGGIVWIMRQHEFGSKAQSVMSQLSSVLAQSSSTPRGQGSISPGDSRRGGGQTTITSPGRSKSTVKVS